ncbi:hypothetical protein CTheo_7501 [Ceratobasidium theobromae]|uniref:Uncharacterized protein n=1 Tax=Ceratobasidium theobromae TaxID=1582974 RepID=A0A5N5QBP1_9AGAM|nr:hypothetical protein CTheo_7501 [Ceratobasidium theobromae]
MHPDGSEDDQVLLTLLVDKMLSTSKCLRIVAPLGLLLVTSTFASGTPYALGSKPESMDCKTVTVDNLYKTCYDIYTKAGITASQLSSYNPRLDCATLQLGQRVCISAGTLLSRRLAPNPDGSCVKYKVLEDESCPQIAARFNATVPQLESWNAGCDQLQFGYTMCVSSGSPPPITVDPKLQCGPESPGNATCPLNGCCSAFGYCGVTAEFCGPSESGEPCTSNCHQPTLPSCSTSQIKRKVGYFAGWNNRAKCGQFSSKQVDPTRYTHILYAFATFGPDMKITLPSHDIEQLKDLVSRKGATKIIPSAGGWSFSQEESRSLFTDMISTSANRAAFIQSVKSFISQYQLDGIDISMEYPASIERAGPSTDTPNLTALFKELRDALPNNLEVSLATPSSYWFLKGFELDKIAPHVSFINMMSYDYHGSWDANINGTNSSALPHTSLEDIKESVLLYTRAGIDMSKVNLGLATYGRTYALADPNCNAYGCRMTGSGAPGECTGSSGFLSYFELSRMVNTSTIHYDETSQTKWMKHGTDLITFDDMDTWAAKKDFAAKTCFGGTMLWNIQPINICGCHHYETMA